MSTTDWSIRFRFSEKMTGRVAYKALKYHFQGRLYLNLMKTKYKGSKTDVANYNDCQS